MRRTLPPAVLIALITGPLAAGASAQSQLQRPRPAKLPSVVEVKDITAPVGESVVLEARLISNKGELLGDRALEFRVGTKPLGIFQTSAAATAAAGLATAPFTISTDYRPGSYGIEVRFAGDDVASPGTGRATLTVVQGRAVIELEPITELVHMAHDFVVKGVLRNLVDSQPIAGRPVTVTMQGVPAGTVTTREEGWFQQGLRAPAFMTGSGESTYTLNIEVAFAGDVLFTPARAALAIQVVNRQPPPVITSVYPKELTEGSAVGFRIYGSDLYPAGMDPNIALQQRNPSHFDKNPLQVHLDKGHGFSQCDIDGWADVQLAVNCYGVCSPPDVKLRVSRAGVLSNVFVVPVKKKMPTPAAPGPPVKARRPT